VGLGFGGGTTGSGAGTGAGGARGGTSCNSHERSTAVRLWSAHRTLERMGSEMEWDVPGCARMGCGCGCAACPSALYVNEIFCGRAAWAGDEARTNSNAVEICINYCN